MSLGTLDRTTPSFMRQGPSALSQIVLYIALALLLMVIEGSTLGALSWLLEPLFDKVFTGGRGDLVLWVGAGIFGLFLIRAVTSIASRTKRASSTSATEIFTTKVPRCGRITTSRSSASLMNASRTGCLLIEYCLAISDSDKAWPG